MSKLAKYLKTKRQEANLTQAAVARFLGYKTSMHISNWETGRQNPPNDVLYSLFVLYRLDEEEFISVLSESAESIFREIISGKTKGKRQR